jgi:periplasmic protein CpxP/Spy
MKSIRTCLIATSLLLGATGLTLAQTVPETPSHGHRAERMEKMHAKMGERHAQHLSDLKGKLKLEAGQEASWTIFEQSMQAPTKPMPRPDPMGMEKMTTPERIEKMQARQALRDAEMKKHADATIAFYATLNTNQKKIFDSETARFTKSMSARMRHGNHHASHH